VPYPASPAQPHRRAQGSDADAGDRQAVPGQSRTQHEALDAAVDALAAEIASKAGSVLRRGKAAFTRQLGLPLADAYAFAREQALENIVDPDAREGIAAFLEKREPLWRS
jgi:enoyl-CoA hydratase/carnithine racemase